MRYYYPCKPNQIAVESDLFKELDNDSNWIAEVKMNGIRCLIYSDETTNPLWTRHNTIIKDELLNIRNQIIQLPSGCILDGELISKRPKNWEKFLYLFDVIMWEGKLLIDLPLIKRKAILKKIYNQYLRWSPKIVLAAPVILHKKNLYYSSIGNALHEGIVIKRKDSKYMISTKSCPQNPFWIKVKKQDKMFHREA